MNETDVKDSRGNVVISKGLKVRHKDSQFEYTVDSVLQEPDGEVTIMLASPEAPRFEPAEEEIMIVDKNVPDVLYEAEPVDNVADLFYVPDEDETEADDDLLAIPAKEFEKEYEVK